MANLSACMPVVLSSARHIGRLAIFSLLLSCACFRKAASLNPAFVRPQFVRASRAAQVVRKASEAATEEEKQQAAARSVTLHFVGESSYSTSPLSSPESIDTMHEFFKVEEYRNLLMSGKGNNVVEPAELTPELFEKWKAETNRTGASTPVLDDKIVRVTTAGISFPGLKLLSIATIGAKLIPPSSLLSYPEYEFTLITDETKPVGAPPIVWIFNKLTGAGNEKKNEDGEQNTHSFSKITVESAEDGAEDQIVFTINARLDVYVKFPSFLLKILPVSKEKAEEQGSTSIQKAVTRDIKPSLDKFGEAYMKLLSSS